MPRKHKTIHYLDTHCEGDYNYECYVEACKEDGKKPAAESSNEYWDWISDMIQCDYDDFFDNLKYADCAQQPCVITGTLDLWFGTPDIEPVMEPDLGTAIKHCQADCDAIQVDLTNGVVEVRALHHDGTNCFEIRPLTKRGVRLMEDGEDINPTSRWHVTKYPKYLF